jgi:outer membrane immunogenic protein
MKKILLGSVALAALLAGPALAADMRAPVYKAPPPAVPVFSWTGVYIGLNAGGAWGRSDATFTPTGLLGVFPAWDAAAASLGSPTQRPAGFTGGAQIGFNWQAGFWVFGAEADIQYLGLKASTRTPTFTIAPIDPSHFTTTTQTDWLVTVRPRVGIAFDRGLIYATGGLAVADRKFSNVLTFDIPVLDINTGSVSKTVAGWTAGGGIEYMITPNWSIRGEYLHVDLGDVSYASTNNLNPTVTANHFERLRVDIARAAINYRFGSGPVVANY